MSGADPLSNMFAAFADPTRRAILSQLAMATLSAQEVASGLDLSLCEVIAEVEDLEAAGLVAWTSDTPEPRLALRAERIFLVETWLSWFRRFQIEKTDRLSGCADEVEPLSLHVLRPAD